MTNPTAITIKTNTTIISEFIVISWFLANKDTSANKNDVPVKCDDEYLIRSVRRVVHDHLAESELAKNRGVLNRAICSDCGPLSPTHKSPVSGQTELGAGNPCLRHGLVSPKHLLMARWTEYPTNSHYSIQLFLASLKMAQMAERRTRATPAQRSRVPLSK